MQKVTRTIEITKEIYDKYHGTGVPSKAYEEVYGRVASMVFIYGPCVVYKTPDGKYAANYSFYE